MGNKIIKQVMGDKALEGSVRSWYTSNYPTDGMGGQIREELTFKDMVSVLESGDDVYVALDVSDSLIRERVFEELSSILKVSYDVIYEKWLGIVGYSLPIQIG